MTTFIQIKTQLVVELQNIKTKLVSEQKVIKLLKNIFNFADTILKQTNSTQAFLSSN